MRAMNLTLLTDLYELTMMQGYFKNPTDQIVVFDAFFRKNPCDGGYAIAAGLEQVIDYLKNLSFTEEDIESINKSLKEFSLTYQSLDKLLQSPHDFPKNEILSNEDIVKNLKRESDCIFFEYEDFAEKAASNEYAQKVYEAYLKFEAICKKMGLIQSQY